MSEFTVFIIVRIPSLKESSNLISAIVSNIISENNDNIKIIIVKKYLLISDFSVLKFDKDVLFK